MALRGLRTAATAVLIVVAAGCAGPSSAPVLSTAAASARPSYSEPEPEPESRLVPSSRQATASSVSLLADPTREWNLVVLGDSTGDDPDEFPFLAAEQLGTVYNRPAIVHRWIGDRGYGEEATFPSGRDAAPIHVWNGSVSGSVGMYAANNLEAMTPAGADLVLINYGHNYAGPQQAREGISQLLEDIDIHLGRPPILMIIQNPKNPETVLSSAITGQVRSTASAYSCETVDVYSVFKNAVDPDRLLLDDTHPSPAGSKVWADTVVKALS